MAQSRTPSLATVPAMRTYRLGDADLDRRLEALVEDATAGGRHGDHAHDEDLIAELLVTGLKMLRDDPDRADLKLANSALKEMRYSFLVFSRYRDVPKVTMFGSARTPPHDPNYALASEFARVMSDERGWMVITGAGPGIMEAGNIGAGPGLSFGVNIRLPFEAEANPHVHESRLINFKYFFTRKLMFMKESDGFALFPGGFGTQDECFELLTLIQTGKSPMAPIVMVEEPGSGYWDGWRAFVDRLEEQGMISPTDRCLFRFVNSAAAAADEICHFYDNYHSQRYVDGTLILRLHKVPSPGLVADLNKEFADILKAGEIEVVGPTAAEERDGDHIDLPRLRVPFNRRGFARLRQLIDRLNDAV